MTNDSTKEGLSSDEAFRVMQTVKPASLDNPGVFYAVRAAKHRRNPMTQAQKRYFRRNPDVADRIVEEWAGMCLQEDGGDPRLQRVKLDAITSWADRSDGKPFTRGEIRQTGHTVKTIELRGVNPAFPPQGSHVRALQDRERARSQKTLPTSSEPSASPDSSDDTNGEATQDQMESSLVTDGNGLPSSPDTSSSST